MQYSMWSGQYPEGGLGATDYPWEMLNTADKS